MIASLKSESRKLLSIRSTYILIAAVLALITLFSYLGTSASMYQEAVCDSTGQVLYSMEYSDPRLQSATAEEICGGPITITNKTIRELPKDKLLANIQESVSVMVVFVAIVVVLLMAHEFRYNTINYTLTISNSRSKVLLSKLLVSAVFIAAATLLAMGVSAAVTQIAVNAKDLTLPAQDFNWLYILMRQLGYALAFGLLFLGFATLVRNLVAGIIAIFLLPIINGIGSLLLATRDIEPTKILPFSALERFSNVVVDVMENQAPVEVFGQTSSEQATVLVAGMVAAMWLLGLWVITWILFLKRDAN